MAYLSIWLLKNASAIMTEGVPKLLDLRRFLRKRRAITSASKIALKTPSPSQPGLGFVYLKVRAARPLGGLDATGPLLHLAVFSRVALGTGSANARLHRSSSQHVPRRGKTCSCPHTGVTMTRLLPHRHFDCPKWCAPRYTVPPSLVIVRVLLVRRSAPSTHRPRRPGVNHYLYPLLVLADSRPRRLLARGVRVCAGRIRVPSPTSPTGCDLLRGRAVLSRDRIRRSTYIHATASESLRRKA
ncbi:hypothetical protein VTO73DRAFT_5139 [Trametes versicolor]